MSKNFIDLTGLEWGTQIKVRMAAVGITGRALAAEIDITESYLSGILADKRGDETNREKVEAALSRFEAPEPPAVEEET